MTFMRRPRVFLSYRHEERRGLLSAHYNARHRDWVQHFAHALGEWGVDVVWDERLRELFRPLLKSDPARLSFLAEVSTLCLQVAQVFMPVVTCGYLERIAAHDGTVSEEWRNGMEACGERRAELVAIVREWPIPGVAVPPALIASDNGWDFRFVAPTGDEVELLGDALQGVWSVDRPAFDQSFSTLIRSYVDFCVSACALSTTPIERWGCDFERPRAFVRFMNARPEALDPGRQRDIDEFLAAFGDRIPRATSDTPLPPPIDPTDELRLEDEAKALMRKLMASHLETHRKSFPFEDNAPGSRASKGLYFGPTLPGFSYLHPQDPRRV
jgi:hypothetical protein